MRAMATDVEGSPARHHHLEAVPATVSPFLLLHEPHHPPLPHHHHLSHVLQNPYQHHHHHYLLPPPFLCTRCKCWNFPFNPSLNSHLHHDHLSPLHPFPHNHPIPHHHHPHSHPLPLLESAECLQAQEFPDVNAKSTFTSHTNYHGDNISCERYGADDIVDEEEEYEFVMTDEWMEFFAKSEARRQEKKRQKKKAARDLRKATRARCQTQDNSQRQVDE